MNSKILANSWATISALARWPQCLSDPSVELEGIREAGDVPTGRKYGGGSPWRGILWGGCKCDSLLLRFSADLRAPGGVSSILCQVSLPLSSLSLHSLVCQSEQAFIWMGFSSLSRKALTRYQMLFRHMFYCKHVERQLCNVWISNKTAKQFSLHSAKWYSLFCLFSVLGLLLACKIPHDILQTILK